MTGTDVSASGPATRQRPTLLPGIAMVAVTFGLARYGYGLLLPRMRADLQLSAGAAGIISSLAYVAYLGANVGTVVVINRRGPRAAVLVAGVLAVAGMAVIATSQSAFLLGLGVLIGGAAAGFAFPPYSEMVAGRIRPERRDPVWAAISSGTGWGVAVAGPIAIVAGDRWRLAWAAFIVATVIAVVPSVLVAEPRARARSRRPQLSWTWFFCPKSRPLLLSSVLLGVGSSVWWAFSVDALQVAGTSSVAAEIVYAVCGAASVLASLSGTAFTRFGLRRGYLASCLLLGVSLAILAFTTTVVAGALVAAVLFGVFYCAVIAAGGIWSSRVFADHPAAGLAAYECALTVGTLIGPTAAGFVIDGLGYRTALLGAAVIVVAALPFCPPTARRRERLAAHECHATPVRD